MFYMFSGPDFLYADAFYSKASTYVLGALEPVGGQEGRALGEVAQDRVRLGQAATIGEFEQRDLAVRVLRQEFGRARGAVDAVGFDPAIRALELLEQKLELLAVSRRLHAVDGHRVGHFALLRARHCSRVWP